MLDTPISGPTETKINLQTPEIRANPYPTFAMMREHHPVCQVVPDGFWAISRYDDIQFALKRHDLFSSTGFEPLLKPDWLREDCRRGSFLLMEDPPSHTLHRALVNKAFTTRSINALIPLMRETSQRLVTAIKNNKDVDFLEDFAYPYIGKIIGQITGIGDSQSLDEIRHWVELLETIPPTRPDDQFIEKLEAGFTKQNNYFNTIVEDRRANPRQDLISELAQAEVNGKKLSDDLLRQALDLIVGAGFQTTIQALCFSMMQLARQPQLMHLLKSSPELIPAFIEEILRFNPPGQCVMRQTTQAVTLSDITLPKDAKVFLMLVSANRDASQFSNPDVFDISRTNNKTHVAFSYGIHACVGSPLARLEIKIALETIVNAFEAVNCPADDELVWIDSFMSHGVCALPINFAD